LPAESLPIWLQCKYKEKKLVYDYNYVLPLHPYRIKVKTVVKLTKVCQAAKTDFIMTVMSSNKLISV